MSECEFGEYVSWDDYESLLAERDRLKGQVETLTGWYANSLDVVNEVTAILPGAHYMDPPDGGDVSIPEQVRRMAKDAERWLPVDGFEGIYEVSSVGRVRSIERVDTAGNKRRAKILLPTSIPKGYLKVSLWRSNQRSERYVHRLVAGAFIGNPAGLLQVNHVDGDPANNAASNLEWVSNAGNQQHARRVLMKGVRAVFGISKVDGSRIEFPSLQHAVEAGFIRANIQKCLNGERKMHRGYKWYDAALQGEQP